MLNLRTLNLRAVIMFFHTLVWTVAGLAAALLDPTGRLFMYVARAIWAKQVLRLSGIRPAVRGLENVEKEHPYIICANHQSQIDIPILFGCLPVPIRFLAKRSLFFIPVFGWSLFLAGFIPVDRGKGAKARRSIERGAERIKKGPSLVVFPEGTRTPDGSVHPFKSGAFVMAVKSGVPVLPVAIRGTFHVVPKTSLSVIPSPVDVIIGRPIPTTGLTMKDKEDLRIRTQQAVERMVSTAEPV